MGNKEKSTKERKTREKGFDFPFGDSQGMSEMMSKCWGSEEDVFDCCAMMKRIMNDKSVKTKEENGKV